MLRTFLIILLFVFNNNIFSQNIVDVRITRITNSNIEITLFPQQQQYSILSNVVFTLTWRTNRILSLGTPIANSSISMIKSGPVLTNGNMRYQVFSGVGLISNNIQNGIKIVIPKTGTSSISIANNNFIKNILVNGGYYVSIGGVDVTGSILTTKSTDIEENSTFDSDGVKLYYSRNISLMLIKKNGEFITLLGQKIEGINENDLIYLGER